MAKEKFSLGPKRWIGGVPQQSAFARRLMAAKRRARIVR